ncbi:MAG: hypothetical protein HY884_01165 [Deltaproteobacteria bacterium]|nr:hypothetical protein [Deltaproteobacteria bacterium]
MPLDPWGNSGDTILNPTSAKEAVASGGARTVDISLSITGYAFAAAGVLYIQYCLGNSGDTILNPTSAKEAVASGGAGTVDISLPITGYAFAAAGVLCIQYC